MNRGLGKENGMALVLVLIVILICTATFIAIYSGVRTQSKVTSVIQGSQKILADAEDGLGIAETMLKQSTTQIPVLANNATELNLKSVSGSGNIIKVTCVAGANPNTLILKSVATTPDNKFSRTVIETVTYNPATPKPSTPDCGFLSYSKISANGMTVGFDMFSNDSISFGDWGGKLVNNCKISTPKNITLVNNNTGWGPDAQTHFYDGSKGTQAIPDSQFPKVDFNALKVNNPASDNVIYVSSIDDFKTKVKALKSGQMLILETDTAAKLDNLGTFTVADGATLAIMSKRTKDGVVTNSKSQPDFTVSANMNGNYNLLVEGNLTIQSCDPVINGVLYCGKDLTIKWTKLAVKGGIISRGAADIQSLTFTFDKSKYDAIGGLITWGAGTGGGPVDNTKIVFSGWHEI